jgi:hypothetical protein
MAYIEVSFNDYMPILWNGLMQIIGNEKGVAALMGNIYAESGCTPYACQPSRPYNVCMTYINAVNSHQISEWSFVHRGTSSTGGVAGGQGGFGLCQWTYYSRKQIMYNLWEEQTNSIGDIYFQIDFIDWELNNTHGDTLTELENATDIDDATEYVLFNYEGPADKSAEVQDTRSNYAQQIYDHYVGTTPVDPPDPQPPSVDPPQPEPQAPIKIVTKRMPIWMYPSLRG